MAHGKNILLPVGNYYNAQFTDEDGDYYQMREMSEAADIFDPIFFSKQPTSDILNVLHDLADKRTVFGLRHFYKKIIKKLKKEMPKLVKDHRPITTWLGSHQ